MNVEMEPIRISLNALFRVLHDQKIQGMISFKDEAPVVVITDYRRNIAIFYDLDTAQIFLIRGHVELAKVIQRYIDEGKIRSLNRVPLTSTSSVEPVGETCNAHN